MKEGNLSARDRIREYFEKNVGRIVTTHEIAKVGRISEYARRIRELRELEGMQIKTHKDRNDLKPGEYILESLERPPLISRSISPQLRMEILERNGYTCQLCGAAAGNPEATDPKRKVRLHIDHIIPLSQGGKNEKENLRVLCSECNQARSNIQTASETALNLLARIRRSSRKVQEEVFDKLKAQFEK